MQKKHNTTMIKRAAVYLKLLLVENGSKLGGFERIWGFLDRNFNFEVLQFLKARTKFNRELRRNQNLFLYKRNIHRIEKGILLNSSGRPFAKDYVNQTTKLHQGLKLAGKLPPTIESWGESVLYKYSSYSFASDIMIGSEWMPAPQVSYDNGYAYKQASDFTEIAENRRSVRHYKQGLIDHDVIQKVVRLACSSPSACNRQPYTFKFVQGKKASQVLKLAGGTSGWADDVENTIAVMGDLSAYSTQSDRHLIYIDASLAAMQLINALHYFGLVSCCVNWGFDSERNKKLSTLIPFSEYEQPIMLIAFGYPEINISAPISRKELKYEIYRD